MFQEYIDTQVNRVKASSCASLLGGEAACKFERELSANAERITGSTVTKLISMEAAASNSFAASFPALLTDEARRGAIEAIGKKLKSGELVFPKTLTDTLTCRLTVITDAFLEMLGRMFENRKAICDELTDGKLYTKIEDIQLFAGDSHNHGRSVTVLHTDVGRLVYKPRDVRGDRYIRAVADRFFSEFTGIPKCVAFGDSFGVCEYIEKRRSVGEKEARAFWYHAGGMALFAKLLGSIDMHIENLTCRDGKPYLIDLETALFPVVINDDFRMRHPELRTLMTRSPYLSGLLPGSMGDERAAKHLGGGMRSHGKRRPCLRDGIF